MTALDSDPTQAESASQGVFHREGDVDIAVVIVSYNSAGDIVELLHDLRVVAKSVTLRVIVVDNASPDGSLEHLAKVDDLVALASGGNLGYSAGINVGLQHAGACDSVCILNPDLRLENGAIERMLTALREDTSRGAVVPLMLEDDDEPYPSLRRDPSTLRALGDAAFGWKWRSRPGILSETELRPSAYRTAHAVDWATGAAILISAEAATAVGAWDEQFFLYSEEVDYQRRIRDAGWQIWFEPSAVVRHRRGGSGQHPDLAALMTVNKVRYIEKTAPNAAGRFRFAVTLGAHARLHNSSLARTRWALRRRARWHALPGATVDADSLRSLPRAAVIIPAHNEGAVIARTLEPLAPLAEAGHWEVVVVCNACTDDTAAQASMFPGVHVIETDTPGKTAALNLGDSHATLWPRVYLDADIHAPVPALVPLIRDLHRDGILAGRPSAEYDTEHSSPVVRSYVRARQRAFRRTRALWGAGVYAMNEAGHARLGEFPAVTADDLYVDQLFDAREKTFPDTPAIRVRMPRTTDALLAILTRARRGPAQQNVDTGSSTAKAVIGSIRGPRSALDAGVYVALALIARRRAGRAGAKPQWERDDTTRQSPQNGTHDGS